MKPKHKRARSPCSQIRDIAVRLDLFGYVLDKKQIDGLKLYRSIFGTLLTLVFLTILVGYTVYKYNSMRLYNDTNIMTSVYESYYSDDFVFTAGKHAF